MQLAAMVLHTLLDMIGSIRNELTTEINPDIDLFHKGCPS